MEPQRRRGRRGEGEGSMKWFGSVLGKGQQKVKYFWFVTFAFLILAFLVLWQMSAPAEVAKHYTELKFPPLPEIKLPTYTRYELNNGMVVFLMEDRELPLVSGTAMFRTGDRLEPLDKVGLAGLAGEVMRTGGTSKHSADELNQLLEQRAASVESGVDTTSGSVSFNALSEDLEEVFGLFAEVIRTPIFAADKFELAKNQQAGAIARRNDDPKDIASREFQKLLYGDRSPYARTIEYATLDKISRSDAVSFYQQNFHPNNMILGIVGDFDGKKMRSSIEQKFGDWKPDPKVKKLGDLPQVSQAKQGGVFLVNQPQLTQSNVLIGHLGGQLNSPDYAALSVLNGVLNGFGGRLFNQVRSRQGLAYTVYAAWSPKFDYPGTFVAGGQTRSDATVPFIQSILAEIDRIRNEAIAPDELEYAKDSTLNSFIFNFQDPAQTLSRLMRYEYFGYPDDFIFQYRKGVEATTIEDVQRVAKKYLQPDKLVTLVVGNASAINPPLTSLGNGTQVTSIDISIPEPKSS